MKLVALIGWVIWPVLLATVFILYRMTTQWRIETWADYAGKLQARIWFQEGRLRLLELSPGEKSQFTGRKAGEFEVWTWTNYPNPPWLATASGNRQFVTALNLRMRELLEEKNKQKR